MRDFFDRLARRAATTGGDLAISAPGAAYDYRRLLARIRDGAAWARPLPARIGLLFGATADYILADLALSFAGKQLVPLPSFFSDGQLAHIVRAARLTHAVTDAVSGGRARTLGLVTSELGGSAGVCGDPAAEARRIVFTSGSTGRPKGVRLSSRQLLASADALSAATGARASDRYMSLLPSALLLEQVAGIYVPLMAGASIHVPPDGNSRRISIVAAVEQVNPTSTVLVPELLMRWMAELEAVDRAVPGSLRFVAVGGAPLGGRLVTDAWRSGIPAYQGYGLSECCSVVAVNRPGDPGLGTVGQPLPGLEVNIENGEIRVSGPTVMDGYLDEPDQSGPWPTGDLGRIDADGRLIVSGRKDNIIVTAAGRNVSPEWIEDAITAHGTVRRCIVVEQGGELVAVVTPTNEGIAGTADPRGAIGHAARELPDYAKPRHCLVLSDRELIEHDLLTPNGRPRRAAIRAFAAEHGPSLRKTCEQEESDVPV